MFNSVNLTRHTVFDDAVLATHTEEALQRLIDCFSQSHKDFRLTISIKKTNVSAQNISQAPSIKIDDHTLDVVDEFTYLGSTISMNLFFDTEIKKRKGKASATMIKLTQQVWKNSLTQNTKVRVYQVCILSTLLYGSETLEHLHEPGTSTQHLPHVCA